MPEKYRILTEHDSIITVYERTEKYVYYAKHNEACTKASFEKMPPGRFDVLVNHPFVKSIHD